MAKKLLLVFFSLILIAILGLLVFIHTGGPDLPQDCQKLIVEAIEDGPPELVHGQTGMAYQDGVGTWYEIMPAADSPRACILLVMGIANTSMAWPQYFIQPLIDSGYQVIRYDHRGLGMSDWMEDWDEQAPYTLEDMARDGMGVLDDLGIARAHVIGVSLGGMIAQSMAIHHPDRVLSLSSLMSSGYIEDPDLPGISGSFITDLVKLGIRYGIWPSERNTIKLHIASRLLLQGQATHALDISEIAGQVLYEMRERNGYNKEASPQQLAATSASGSRLEALPQIKVPVLIAHGSDDPLIPFAHGQKCARLIPQAKSLWLEGMGHDISPAFAKDILQAIFLTLAEADRTTN